LKLSEHAAEKKPGLGAPSTLHSGASALAGLLGTQPLVPQVNLSPPTRPHAPAAPAHLPAWQLSPLVHGLPSLQASPLTTGA
jgi:hypothetical protein